MNGLQQHPVPPFPRPASFGWMWATLATLAGRRGMSTGHTQKRNNLGGERCAVPDPICNPDNGATTASP